VFCRLKLGYSFTGGNVSPVARALVLVRRGEFLESCGRDGRGPWLVDSLTGRKL
jgi:hypothetical protein